MSICLVFQLQYPWDIRVEKMISSLNKAKYKVDLVCRNEDGLPVREQVNDYFAIHRLPGGAGNVSRKILNFPAFFSPVWIGKILSTIRQSNSKLVCEREHAGRMGDARRGVGVGGCRYEVEALPRQGSATPRPYGFVTFVLVGGLP